MNKDWVDRFNERKNPKKCNQLILAIVADWITAEMARHKCEEHNLPKYCDTIRHWRREMKKKS